ncbi:Ig-like domain (group 2) [Prevotellaceae bacterium MN60]|nr:Ig-like domain (group 2) [Prevotellaceae bacterium MN60]
MLLLCALVGSIPSVWANEWSYTFNASSGISAGSKTLNSISWTIAHDSDYENNEATGFHVGSSSKTVSYLQLSTSGISGVISKIVVRAKGNGTGGSISASVNGTAYTAKDNNNSITNAFQDFEFSGSLSGAIVIRLSYSSAVKKNFYVQSIAVTYTPAAAGTTSAPAISGTTPFLGSTTVTITNDTNADGASIYYTLDGSDPTTTTSSTCFAYTAPFSIDATTTVKAIAKKSTDTNASSVVSKTFTKITPLTVSEALAAIDGLSNNGTINDQYVSGVVVSITNVEPDNGTIKYYISDDGSANNQLYVYKGKGLNNADFTNVSELQIGDEVVIFGQLKKFNTTPEINEGNYLISQTHKPAPSFTLDITEKSLDAYTHETVDVTLTTNTDGVVSYESSNTDVATVAQKSAGVYTITAQSAGTATITIKSATSANYAPASATVAVTVTDTRSEAEISFDETAVAKTWGDAFAGQTLTNPHSLDVAYSSTDETVATVSSTGAVEILKAGSTTIKATFAGNATYKAAIASYTLTVAKAEPNLSFSQTNFQVPLNDNSFVAPTLNNPNNLTVGYSSNNESVALVDENTGEIVLETSAVGSATITAYFAGNDKFKGGHAEYTIDVYDPNVKGSRNNPYSVADIIALNPTSTSAAAATDVYVKGYIAGCVNSSTGALITTSSSFVNSNLALVDDPDNTDEHISVQLVSGSNRTNYNVVNHPELIGTIQILIKADVFKYCGVPGLKNLDEVSVVSERVKVTSIGLATFASNNKLDFTNVENLEAYIAKENGDKVELTKVNKVAAGTGVLLRAKNDATTFEVPVTTDDADDATGNLFVRGTGAAVATTDGSYTNYILSTKSGVVGFYHANNNIVAVNRAYLHTSVSAARIDLSFDELTGINEMKNQKEAVEGIFDLQGRKVAQPAKGLYIVNGKKVVIK